MKYTLQNLVFPKLNVCNQMEMYLRTNKILKSEEEKIYIGSNQYIEFSTYFNSLSIDKWKKYTKIKNLWLEVEVRGNLNIELYESYLYTENVIIKFLKEEKTKNEEIQKIRLEIPFTSKGSVFFKILNLGSENGEILNARYYTEIDENELKNVEIALVMCTFKREDYLLKNVELIKNNLLANDKYNSKNSYDIKIVDNGQTLSKQIENERIKLYPNMNVGGAGGFTRGIIESLKSEKNYSHILLMDDDVLVETESFEKTYNILRLLKEEYKDSFIGGAMLRLDRQNIQHELVGTWENENYLHMPLKLNLDLNKLYNILFNEKTEIAKNRYLSWWYCCIPTTVARLDNLPLPIFIKIDDMEYSIRNKKNNDYITMNGLSVWHEAFDNKYSTMMDNYYTFRNILHLDIKYFNPSYIKLSKFIIKRFMREIARYDYSGMDLLLDGLDDFLKGPNYLKAIDCSKLLKEKSVKQNKLINIEENKEYEFLYWKFYNEIHNKIYENKIQKYIRFASLNGHLFPNFMFKKLGYAEYGYESNSKNYYRKKQIFIYDKNNEKYMLLEISRKDLMTGLFRLIKLLFKLKLNLNKLKKDYNKSFKELTSVEFWENYLKIKNN